MQTTFSKSYVSQSVSLHDTTGRLRSGKCYLRSFPHFSFSSSARNSITMSTAPQQDLLTSAQPQSVVSNVLISVCSQPSSTSPPLSLYPAIPLCPLVTSLLLRLQFAVVVDPRLCLLCLAPLRPKCPIFRATLCLQVHTAVVPNLFRLAAPYKTEIKFPAPSGEPIAIWIEFW